MPIDLSKLSDADLSAMLEKVHAEKMLRGSEGAAKGPTSAGLETAWFDAISEALRERIGDVAPIFAIQRSNRWKGFTDAIPLGECVVTDIVRGVGGGQRVLKQQARCFCGWLIVGRMVRVQVPLSASAAINQLQNVATAVHDGFPNYRKSGLLPMVFKRYISGELRRI